MRINNANFQAPSPEILIQEVRGDGRHLQHKYATCSIPPPSRPHHPKKLANPVGTTLPALLSKERREGALTHSADPARAIQTSVGDKTKTPVAWVLVCGLGHFSWPPGISQQPWNWWFLPLTFSLPMLEWQVPYSLSQRNSPCDREALMTGLGEQLLHCIASTKQALSVPSEIRYGIPLKTSPSSTHG